MKFFNIFDQYQDYDDFIDNHIFKITGYNNILQVIKSIITCISDNYKMKDNENLLIVLDNYDDHLVGEIKLSQDYIEDLYKIINSKNIKILILGKGLFISNLLIYFFFKKEQIKKYIYVKYITSLNLGLENEIHNFLIEHKNNEIDSYFKEKYNIKENDINLEHLLYNLVIIKNIPYLINENLKQEFPFQFFKLSMKDNKFNINFQHNDFYDISNEKIKEYSTKINSLVYFSKLDNQVVKGFIFEELLVSIFKNNKAFKNLEFTKDNIIQVEEIYNMGYIKAIENLVNGPILITQKKNGEVFDFGFVIKENNVDYFVGGQAGLNKTNEEITKYIIKIKENEGKIIQDISTLTKREISQIRFIIFLNKESQEEMKKDYDNIYYKLKSLKEDNLKKMTLYEKTNYNMMKRKINHFNNNFGTVCCENNSIAYMLFSIKDLRFYINGNIIENFNILDINPIKDSFELFCCVQYKLIPCKNEISILDEAEGVSLINQIKSDNPKVIGIKKIEYEIPVDLPFSMGTPENTGILTIIKEVKLFTYFYQNKFIHYVFEKSCINKYYDEKFLFQNNYDFEFAKRFFIFLKESSNFETEVNGGNEEKFYKNKIRFIQKKRNK